MALINPSVDDLYARGSDPWNTTFTYWRDRAESKLGMNAKEAIEYGEKKALEQMDKLRANAQADKQATETRRPPQPEPTPGIENARFEALEAAIANLVSQNAATASFHAQAKDDASRLTNLETAVRGLTQQYARSVDTADTIQGLSQQVEYLLACMKSVKPNVPLALRIPAHRTLVKVDAQLFVNPNPGSGRSEHVIKLYVWDSSKPSQMMAIWRNGYFRPFNVPLRREQTEWTGCISHKGAGKDIKGTTQVRDQIVTLGGDFELTLTLPNGTINLGCGTPARSTKKENAAVHLWYWQV